MNPIWNLLNLDSGTGQYLAQRTKLADPGADPTES